MSCLYQNSQYKLDFPLSTFGTFFSLLALAIQSLISLWSNLGSTGISFLCPQTQTHKHLRQYLIQAREKSLLSQDCLVFAVKWVCVCVWRYLIQSQQTQTRKKVRFKRDKNEPLVLEREKGCWAMEPRLCVGEKKIWDLEWVEIKYGLWVSEKQYEIWSGVTIWIQTRERREMGFWEESNKWVWKREN